MSDESNCDLFDGKRIKLEHSNEKLSCFGATCRNSVVDRFKIKCMEFFTKHLDDKNVRAYNTLKNTGKRI